MLLINNNHIQIYLEITIWAWLYFDSIATVLYDCMSIVLPFKKPLCTNCTNIQKLDLELKLDTEQRDNTSISLSHTNSIQYIQIHYSCNLMLKKLQAVCINAPDSWQLLKSAVISKHNKCLGSDLPFTACRVCLQLIKMLKALPKVQMCFKCNSASSNWIIYPEGSILSLLVY